MQGQRVSKRVKFTYVLTSSGILYLMCIKYYLISKAVKYILCQNRRETIQSHDLPLYVDNKFIMLKTFKSLFSLNDITNNFTRPVHC